MIAELLAALLVAPAQAPLPVMPYPPYRVCGPTMRVLDSLARGYDERIVALGDTSTGGQVLLLQRANGATWTLLELSNNGLEACVLAAGEHWRQAEPLPGVEQ